MADFGLTLEGFVAPRFADYLALIQGDIIEALVERGLNTDIDFDYDVFWGITTTIMARRLAEASQLSQALYDSRDPNNATGLLLDSVGALRGIPRLQATYTTVDLLLTNDTTTPAYLEGGQAIAEGGGIDDRNRWVLEQDITIPASSSVSASFRSQELGVFEASVGLIDKIVTAVAGWSSVTNPAVPSPGRDLESDTDYLRRQNLSLQGTGGQNGNALRASLLLLDGVTSVGVIENEGSTDTVIEGVTLKPHSKAVFIWPNTLTAAQIQEVGQTIYNQTDFGIFTNGTDQTVSVPGADGYEKEINFDWANEVTINWSATVVLDIGFVLADVEEQVKTNVSAYLASLAVGSDVLHLRVLSAIANTTGIIGATLLLNGVAMDQGITASQIAIEGTASVTT